MDDAGIQNLFEDLNQLMPHNVLATLFSGGYKSTRILYYIYRVTLRDGSTTYAVPCHTIYGIRINIVGKNKEILRDTQDDWIKRAYDGKPLSTVRKGSDMYYAKLTPQNVDKAFQMKPGYVKAVALNEARTVPVSFI